MKTCASIVVRHQRPDDSSVVRAINEAAFERSDEADLVEHLHNDAAALISLVAEWETQIVGHILFSRMWIDEDRVSTCAVALAPVAVLPDHQCRGVGEQLIRSGLDCLRARQEQVVLVLGHPHYYERFGFSSDQALALASPFPPEAFVALELVPNALNGLQGKVRYHAAFGL